MRQGYQEVVGAVWLGRIDNGPRSNDLDHFPFDHTDGLLGIFHLLCNSYLVAFFDQDIDVLLGRMIGNSSHGNWIFCIFIPRGQRNL